jgi:hypothetical protein
MTTPTLLGYLAKFASFSTQSEVLCTQGLVYLLQTHADARSAMAHEVKVRSGIEFSESLTWIAEKEQKDGARPDLEAITAEDVPVVKIEAKLGAELTAKQLQSYVNDLLQRNSDKGALLVLVPKGRLAEAAKATAAAFDLAGSGPWRVTDGHRTGMAVISWDELFTALQAGKSERFLYELEQLKAMYRELSGSFIAPLASEEDLSMLGERVTDLINLVDQATRQLTTHHKVYPMGSESLDDEVHETAPGVYRRRFVCSFAGDVESCFCIGVRDSFAKWVTPVWMRFHNRTGNFGLIRQRIEASSLRWLESSGHIWIPLDVPLEVSGEQMVQALVEQAEDVVKVASREEWWS